MARAAVLVLALAVAGAGFALATRVASGRSAFTCASASGTSTTVGTITSLLKANVYVDTAYVGGAPYTLKQGNYVCTDPKGQALFKLSRSSKTTSCNTFPNTKLRVYPPSTPLIILWSNGKTWCKTSKGKSGWFGSYSGTMRLYTSDPVFAVTDTRKTAILAVDYGFVRLSAARAKGVIVGPFQQVTVKLGGTAGAPEAFTPTPQDRAAIAQLAPLPTPDYAPPDPDGSALVKAMFARKSIRVGLADGLDERALTFAKQYLTFLARQWGLKLALVQPADEDALFAQRIDVLVGPTPEQPGRAITTFFFSDEHGGSWSLETIPDQVLPPALRHFLSESLQAGHYASFYTAAFGQQPDYKPLEPLLFP
jgi:hypothetical protein